MRNRVVGPNRFDMAGYESGRQLGFLKKLSRAWEKAHKSVVKEVRDKVLSPIANKTLPNKVLDIGRKMDEKGINKMIAAVAVAVVGTIFTGGAATAALVKAAAAVASKKLSEGGAKDYGEFKAAEQVAAREAEIADVLMKAMLESPEFATIVEQLRAEGYSDEAIAAHWIESAEFYKQALTASENVLFPIVESEVQRVNQTLPPDQQIAPNMVAPVAAGVTERIVQVEAEKATGGGGGAALAIGAAILSALVLGV